MPQLRSPDLEAQSCVLGITGGGRVPLFSLPCLMPEQTASCAAPHPLPGGSAGLAREGRERAGAQSRRSRGI